MKVTIQSGTISGTVAATPSKSATQRAFAAALLTGGISHISSAGASNDDLAALDIIQQLGATASQKNGKIIIDSSKSFLKRKLDADTIQLNCGESGLSIRMLTPIASLTEQPVTIEGKGSLRTRPMDFFDTVLPQVDVKIATNEGKLPLNVQGPLIPQNIIVDGSLSSQFLTGLLMAYSAAGASDVTIEVTDLKSRPYIDLTLQVMQDFGLPVPVNENHERFVFPPKSEIAPSGKIDYTVEGDWSGGAFLLVAGAIAGTTVVHNLKLDSAQADKKIMEALKNSGAAIQIIDSTIQVIKNQLKAFEFDATDCPDLFPPLVALAAYCEGDTTIIGVSRLASKESDRGLTLQEQFGKMGVEILLEGDIMTVKGGKPLKGAATHSCHDHRIAMACAIAALGAIGETTIEAAEAINKSYPDFYQHLQQLGAAIATN